jgi:DNA-binding CsgD family transcriptional regulator
MAGLREPRRSREERAAGVSSTKLRGALASSKRRVPLDSLRLLQVRMLQAALLWLAAGGTLGALTALSKSLVLTAGFGAGVVCIAALALRHSGPTVALLSHRPISLALIATHSLLGLFVVGYASIYVAVLVGLVVINTMVQGSKLALAGFVLAAGGFALGVALQHASAATGTAFQRGDVATQWVAEIPVIATGYLPLVMIFSVFRFWTGPAVAGITDVRDGVSDSFTPALTRAIRGPGMTPALNAPGSAVRVAALGTREREVLDLLAGGLTPQQAALELHLSIAGVRSRIAVAKRALGARTLEQSIAIYLQGRDQ